jgi:thioester reductase-like protein
MNIIAITGVTGFVGSQMLVELAAFRPKSKFILPIRAPNHATALQRFEDLRTHLQKFSLVSANALTGIDGCVCTHDEFLAGNYDGSADLGWAIHCAADTDFSSSLSVAREHNLYCTIDIVNSLRKYSPKASFLYVSTAFVCGRADRDVSEFRSFGRFHNSYEQTKYEGEAAVRESGLPYLIARPSVVVGRYDDGYTKHFRVFYSMFRMWMTGVVPRAPMNANDAVDIIPVDVLCRRISQLMFDPLAVGRVHHIVAGTNVTNARQILQTASAVFSLPRPKFSERWMLNVLSHRWVLRCLPHRLEGVISGLKWHFPYLGSYCRTFLRAETWNLHGESDSLTRFENYGVRLFKFCLETRWGKRAIVKAET